MIKRILLFLICGSPGSGKTWVCTRAATFGFNYVPHDDHINGDLIGALKEAAEENSKPLLTECPFGERQLKADLEAAGFEVKPIFVFEPLSVVSQRYKSRTGKELTQAMKTRAVTIKKRIDEWEAPHGSSEQVLQYLKDLRK